MSEHTFSTREAAALLDLTPREVRIFARAGLQEPVRGTRGEYRFGFRDLVVLRMAAALRRARVPARRIALALTDARRDSGGRVAGLRLEALGGHVVVRDGEIVWRADSGQLQLPLDEAARGHTDPAPAVHGMSAEAGSDGADADADACLERALALEGDQPDEALEWYRRAVAADPERWEAHAGLGFLLQGGGATEPAIHSYRRALEIEADATVRFNLGVALDDLGRSEEAEAAYLGALELDPRLADAHFNLSCLYEKRGDRRAALRHMIRYRELGDA